jgi:hypothetical protein
VAVNPQDYLVSFDFESITRQVDQLNASYSGLGDTLKGITEKLNTDLRAIEASSKRLVDNLGFIVHSIKTSSSSVEYNTSKSLQNYKELEEVTKKISSNFEGFKGGPGGSAQSTGDSKASSFAKKQQTQELSKAIDGFSGQFTKVFNELPGFFTKALGDFSKDLGQSMSGAVSSAKTVMSGAGAGAAAGGAARGVMSKMGTNAFLAVLALAVFGETERQRKTAQLGQLKNVVQSAQDYYSTIPKDGQDPKQSQLGWFSTVQEDWRAFAGISIESSNKVMSTFVNMGYKINQVLGKVNYDYKNLQATVATSTVALDLIFGKAIGFFAGETAKAATDFNYKIGEAENKLKKMYFMAQRTGAGIEGFITGIMGASQSMKQFAVDIESVAVVASRIQKSYKDMGLESQKSADLATSGLEALVGAAMTMAKDRGMLARVQTKYDESMDPNEFYMQYQDTVRRAKEGDVDQFSKLMGDLRYFLGNISGDDRGQFQIMAQSMFGIQDVNILDQFRTNPDMFTKPGKLGGLSKEQRTALNKAVETKGEELTELQKVQRDLIQMLAKIGSGIMRFLVAIVRIMMDLGRTLVALPQIMSADPVKRGALMDQLVKNLEGSFKDVSGSFKDVSGAWAEGPPASDTLGALVGPEACKLLRGTDDYDPSAILGEQESQREKMSALAKFMTPKTPEEQQEIIDKSLSEGDEDAARSAIRERHWDEFIEDAKNKTSLTNFVKGLVGQYMGERAGGLNTGSQVEVVIPGDQINSSNKIVENRKAKSQGEP